MFNIKSYRDATSIVNAVELLSSQNLKIIAGGTDVLIGLHSGKTHDLDLLGIHKIDEIKHIKISQNKITIGAYSTFAAIANNPIIQKNIPVLAEAALAVGGPQIRNVATIGGNICNGAVSADSAPTLFALNAKLKIASQQGEKIIPISEFYKGPGKVNLLPTEMLTEIIIEENDYADLHGKYIKFAMRKAMDIATLGVSVCSKFEGNVISQMRIAMGVAAPTPIRCTEAEAFAEGKSFSHIEEIAALSVSAMNARTSWRASKEYREQLADTLVKRAIIEIFNKAGVSK